MHWQTSRYQIDLRQPRVMGIVNVTPDSFSDGGRHATTTAALAHCETLLRDGADILDIGGESSRPGALPLPLADELDRVLPVLREAVRLGVPVSIDTYKPRVMRAALDLGVDIINDIWALRWVDPGVAAIASSVAGSSTSAAALSAVSVVAAHPACGVCLMHMHREPQTMQARPMQGDVVPQVLALLRQAAQGLQDLGVASERIVLDPGIGFGKTPEQNFSLLARQRELLAAGHPLLVGWSRKSSLAAVTAVSLQAAAALEPIDRLVPSVAAAVLAVDRGARIVRVHDVRETVSALKVWRAASTDPSSPPSPQQG